MVKLDDITKYLDSQYTDDYKKFHNTYFWNTFDDPTEDEIKEFGKDIKILCFRTVGYTIGHIIISEDRKIIKFVCIIMTVLISLIRTT